LCALRHPGFCWGCKYALVLRPKPKVDIYHRILQVSLIRLGVQFLRSLDAAPPRLHFGKDLATANDADRRTARSIVITITPRRKRRKFASPTIEDDTKTSPIGCVTPPTAHLPVVGPRFPSPTDRGTTVENFRTSSVHLDMTSSGGKVPTVKSCCYEQ
jgi:hypothetical protein